MTAPAPKRRVTVSPSRIGSGIVTEQAGVGRVTLYAHFPSREALVETALTRLLAQGDDVLEAVDLTGDPRDGLRALMESGWPASCTTSCTARQRTSRPDDSIRQRRHASSPR